MDGLTEVVNHIRYDSFGKIISETNPAIDHAFAFTGREWDPDARLYYYRARWYDPAVGRFISEDPIGFAAGDANLNRYVGNDPVNWVDPSGLAEEAWHHTLVMQYLRNNGFIDKDGNTTAKVTGGKLNVHSKEYGVMVTPENHTQRPDGVHVKDSDGGTAGMTYGKHFEAEVKRRLKKDGTISIDDLKAAGKATVAKYPKQLGDGCPAPTDYPNKKPLGRKSPRKGSAHVGAVGGLGAAVSGVAASLIENRALEAFESGDTQHPLYPYGQVVDQLNYERAYHWRVINGEDPEVEALPRWRRWLEKMSSSMAISYDSGLFNH